MDSDASFHTSRDASKLLNYVNDNFDKVHLGDGTRCSIVGKGYAQINLSNGMGLRLTDEMCAYPQS